MTPPGARAAAAKAAERSSNGHRIGPARAKRPGPRGGAIPRRVSGPAAPKRSPAPPPRPISRPRPAPTGRERLSAFLASLPDHPLLDRVIRGRAWIPLLGLMLAGIVAMQVELLKLNAATGRSIELISTLQSRNEVLRARVASASDPGRIERLASRMGMTMPGPEAITFLDARSASVRGAIAGIHAPDIAAFEAALPASSSSMAMAMATPTAPAPASSSASNQGSGSAGSGTPTQGAGSADSSPSSQGASSTTTTVGQTATTTTPTASTTTTTGSASGLTTTTGAPIPTVP